jgi:hypothetical protein
MDHVQAKMDVINWITGFVEKPNPLLNGWAPCPYARQARLQSRVDIRIGQNPSSDLENITSHDFKDLDVIALIYDPAIWPLTTFRSAWQDTQSRVLQDQGIYVLEDHPEDSEQVLGVVMNQGTWALLFVQLRQKLEEAAEQLAAKGYYNNWPEPYLESLFHGRQHPNT